jgi:hypothetical protein
LTGGLERWNMDEVYYRILSFYKKAKEEPPTRETVKKTFLKLCKKLGVRREELNIIAGSRAEIYFEGEWNSVSYDSILALAERGVDHVCVEKDGVCEILTDWADLYGIALVNTRGHLTEYCERLMIVAQKSGALVVIITDYEYVGIKIASESPSNVHWIGVNDEMLEYFHLTKEELEIDAENQTNKREVETLVLHSRHLPDKETGYVRDDSRFLGKADLKFLSNWKRIEINAVLATVESERFFEYILHKLQQISPTRDYTRVIKMPSEYGGGLNAVLPKPIRDVLSRIQSLATEAVEEKEEEIINELKTHKGVLKVEEKREEIQKQFTKVLEENENIKKIVKKCSDLLKPGVLPDADNLSENELDEKYWKTGKKE